MTIRLKRSTAAVLIGLMGLLGGMAVSQVADAVSSNPPASASYTSPLEREVKKINRTLSAINENLASSYDSNNLLDEVQQIKENTCHQLDAIAFCHY
jgi:hypothetical protein